MPPNRSIWAAIYSPEQCSCIDTVSHRIHECGVDSSGNFIHVRVVKQVFYNPISDALCSKPVVILGGPPRQQGRDSFTQNPQLVRRPLQRREHLLRKTQARQAANRTKILLKTYGGPIVQKIAEIVRTHGRQQE